MAVQYNAYQNNPYVLQQQQLQTQMQQQNNQGNTNNTNIFWVQGIEGAKAYPVPPGGAVSLWDTENNVVYVKVVDAAGIPQPIRIFDYNERVVSQEQSDDKDYVTKEMLDEILEEKFDSFTKSILKNNRSNRSYNKKYGNQKGGKDYGESTVQSS